MLDLMKASTSSTLAATVIATAAGTGAWFFGLAGAIWPAHPQIAAFVITIAAMVVVKQAWPADASRKKA
jgi:hypothetical protein